MVHSQKYTAMLMIYILKKNCPFVSYRMPLTLWFASDTGKAKYRGGKEMAEMRLVCHMILGLLWQLLPALKWRCVKSIIMWGGKKKEKCVRRTSSPWRCVLIEPWPALCAEIKLLLLCSKGHRMPFFYDFKLLNMILASSRSLKAVNYTCLMISIPSK